jgi:cytochrome c-type biogenesis protein CcmH
MKTRRFVPAALLFVLVGVCLPQTASQLVTPEIRRVGDKLACKCGACNNTVGNCPMIGCHYSSPARERIASMQKAGMSDQSIVDTFVKEMGLVALAVPPAEGFNLMAWVMPFVAIGLGLAAIFVYWKRFRRPAAVASSTSEPVIDEKYRQRIEAETADLD